MRLEVIKRNGKNVPFELGKIEIAIKKAFDSSDVIYDDEVLDRLSLKVMSHISELESEKEIPIEMIQDLVEKTLSENGFYKVAKNYILYRKNRDIARERKNTVLDYKDKINEYLDAADWRVKENSTVSTSLGGLILNNSGAMTANYWLSEIYDEETGNAHKKADIHIHDLSMLSGYCFTGDTKIKTLDGKNLSFKELVNLNIRDLWVYAYDLKNKKIVPVKAINPRITRTTNKIIEITLDNGKKIKSTLDHLYLTRNGEYKKAEDLSIGESLMPLYIENKDNEFFNYKVTKTEIINLEQEIEMYDLTVPNYENFALDSGVFVHNCAGWSLKQLIQEGLGGVEGRITSSPASHLSTLCNQMVNFLGIEQNEWAGAQAFSSFDTYLAPFVKKDNLDYKQVKQCIQSFVYGVNSPSRWGCQAPFTNITLDWVVPNDLTELPALVGGKEMNFRYKDCQKEMDIVNKAFLEIMIEGDSNGRGFQYPMN